MSGTDRDAVPVAPRPRSRGGIDRSRLEDYLGFHVARAEAHLRRLLLEGLAPCELTLAEFSLLALAEEKHGAIQRQLGDALEIAPPNMTKLVGRMARRGLVRRTSSERDGRVQLLRLTATGEELLARARHCIARREAEISALFDSQERALLRALLERLRTL